MKRLVLLFFCILLFQGIFSETENLYTHSASDGVIISGSNRWYLEEFDTRNRPVSGTLWEKGEILQRTNWLYFSDDSQQARTKVVTGMDNSTQTEYDEKGNTVRIQSSDGKGNAVSETVNVYSEKNQLLESSFTKEKTVTKTVFEYSSDDLIRMKEMYVNGELSIRYVYTTEENWTETIFRKSVPVLVETYEKGTRVKNTDEKK